MYYLEVCIFLWPAPVPGVSFIFGASGRLLSTNSVSDSVYLTLGNAAASLPSSTLSLVGAMFGRKVMRKEDCVCKVPREF